MTPNIAMILALSGLVEIKPTDDPPPTMLICYDYSDYAYVQPWHRAIQEGVAGPAPKL